jgi:hypothetical protein
MIRCGASESTLMFQPVRLIHNGPVTTAHTACFPTRRWRRRRCSGHRVQEMASPRTTTAMPGRTLRVCWQPMGNKRAWWGNHKQLFPRSPHATSTHVPAGRDRRGAWWWTLRTVDLDGYSVNRAGERARRSQGIAGRDSLSARSPVVGKSGTSATGLLPARWLSGGFERGAGAPPAAGWLVEGRWRSPPVAARSVPCFGHGVPRPM